MAKRHAKNMSKMEGGQASKSSSYLNIKQPIIVRLSDESGEVLVLMDERGALSESEWESERKSDRDRESDRERERERERARGIKIEETPLREPLSLHCSPSELNAQLTSQQRQQHDIAQR